MQPEHAQVMQQCARGALGGELNFPQIVGRLAAIGVERYHADYSRQEITYYLPDGDSLVVAAPHEPHATATEFSASAVAAAVRQSQRRRAHLCRLYPQNDGGRLRRLLRSDFRPAHDLFRP